MPVPDNVTDIVARELDGARAKLASKTTIKVVKGSGESETTIEHTRLVRKWERITDGIRKYFEAALLAEEFVTNPQAGGETYTGRWKVLRVFFGPVKTAPAVQGVYQVLLYWPESYGDFGEYCAESSPLFHEDVSLYIDSPDILSAEHQETAGIIYGASNRYDPETGLFSGETTQNIARAFPDDLADEGKSADDASTALGNGLAYTETQLRAENQANPPFKTAAELTAYLASHANALVDAGFDINRWGQFNWLIRRTDPVLYPASGTVFPSGSAVTAAHATTPSTYSTANMYLTSDDGDTQSWLALFLNVSATQMAYIRSLVDAGPLSATNGALTYEARPTVNRFGLLDVVLTARLEKSPLGSLSNEMRWRIPGRTYMTTADWSTDEATGEVSVAFVQMQEIELHYAKIFTTMAASYQYIHQADAEGSQPNYAGSGVSKLGQNLFFAHKVISTTDDSALDAAFTANFPT